MLDKLPFACLHAVEQHDGNLESVGHLLEGHDHLGNLPLALAVPVVCASQVLTEGVHDDQFKARKLLNNLLKFLVQKHLIAVIEDAHEVNSRQNLSI